MLPGLGDRFREPEEASRPSGMSGAPSARMVGAAEEVDVGTAGDDRRARLTTVPRHGEHDRELGDSGQHALPVHLNRDRGAALGAVRIEAHRFVYQERNGQRVDRAVRVRRRPPKRSRCRVGTPDSGYAATTTPPAR